MPTVTLNLPAPNFTIKDHRGEQFHLRDFQGRKNVLLVFNRGFM